MSILTRWDRTRDILAQKWGIDPNNPHPPQKQTETKKEYRTEKHVYHESDDSGIVTVRDYEPPPLVRPKREMKYGNFFDDCFW